MQNLQFEEASKSCLDLWLRNVEIHHLHVCATPADDEARSVQSATYAATCDFLAWVSGLSASAALSSLQEKRCI